MAGDNGGCRSMRPARVWLSTAEEIAEAIGCGRKGIPRLVRSEGLPAFKFYGKWTALDDEVRQWSKKMSQRYRKARPVRRRKL